MAEPGRRSRHTLLFMVPTDEHDFGARLVEELGGQAVWTAVARYQQPESHHQLLLAALDLAHGRSQADLRLADSAGHPFGPILRYLASHVRWQDGRELLIAGELAYKWFPREQSPEIAQRFEALARTAWRQLCACTLPQVAYLDGTPIPNARIGRHAKRWLLADPARLLVTEVLGGSSSGSVLAGSAHHPVRRASAETAHRWSGRRA
jgi:hypothetical protein